MAESKRGRWWRPGRPYSPPPPVQQIVGSQVGGDIHQTLYISAANEPARSAYRKQVEQIAPAQLIGRRAELAALAAFCTTADELGSPAYVWWRAPAWSGKSALMSWFVLHPPE